MERSLPEEVAKYKKLAARVEQRGKQLKKALEDNGLMDLKDSNGKARKPTIEDINSKPAVKEMHTI